LSAAKRPSTSVRSWASDWPACAAPVHLDGQVGAGAARRLVELVELALHLGDLLVGLGDPIAQHPALLLQLLHRQAVLVLHPGDAVLHELAPLDGDPAPAGGEQQEQRGALHGRA